MGTMDNAKRGAGHGNPCNGRGRRNCRKRDHYGKDYRAWENPPPDPNANDRNDSFQAVQIPYRSEATTTGWSVWKPWWKAEWVWHETPEAEEEGYWVDEGWWEFLLERHSASLSASMELWGDEKSPTANGKTMKSGYGFHERVMTSVQTDQPDAVTPAQNAVTYFPEFGYKTFWRLLERMGDGYGMTHEFLKTATALTGGGPILLQSGIRMEVIRHIHG